MEWKEYDAMSRHFFDGPHPPHHGEPDDRHCDHHEHHIPGRLPDEKVHDLYRRMCLTQQECADLNHRTEALIRDINQAGLRNGPYYGDDVIERLPGYDEVSKCHYTLYKIHHCDKQGTPVRFDLHLAYGNTTNPGVREPARHASEMELAQIMVPAIGDVSKWYGKVFYDRMPLPSDETKSLFTYGFTRNGKLKVYRDTYLEVNPDQFRRDSIVFAMGCDGIVIKDGVIVKGDQSSGVSNVCDSVARIILGQNHNSKETYILAVGGWGEDFPGMTLEQACNVMLGYGVNIAIQLISGDAALCMDKGALTFPVADDTIPESVAYLYISKKAHFNSELQFSLAWVTQMMNQFNATLTTAQMGMQDAMSKLADEAEERANGDALLRGRLDAEQRAREDAISEVQDDLRQEQEERAASDQNLLGDISEERAARAEGDKTLLDSLNNETTNRLEGDAKLSSDLASEVERAKAKESEISGQISSERTRATDKENELHDAIVNEVNRATQSEQAINTSLQNEVNRATAAEGGLRDAISLEETRATAVEGNLQGDISREVIRATAAEQELRNMMQTAIEKVRVEFEKYCHIVDDKLQDYDEINRAQFESWKNDISSMLKQATDAVSSGKADIQKSIADMNATIDHVEQRLVAKYNAFVEAIVGELNSLRDEIGREPITTEEVLNDWNY